MALIREVDKTAGNAPQLSRRKGLHAFGYGNTKVPLPMDDQDGSVPVLDVVVRREYRVADGRRVQPVRALQIVIDEENLFGSSIHALQVEDASMGEKGLETLVVIPGQVEDRVAPEAGSHSAHPSFVHKRLCCHVVYCSEIILHSLAAPVAGDLVIPCLSKTAKAPALGGAEQWLPATIAAGYYREIFWIL